MSENTTILQTIFKSEQRRKIALRLLKEIKNKVTRHNMHKLCLSLAAEYSVSYPEIYQVLAKLKKNKLVKREFDYYVHDTTLSNEITKLLVEG